MKVCGPSVSPWAHWWPPALSFSLCSFLAARSPGLTLTCHASKGKSKLCPPLDSVGLWAATQSPRLKAAPGAWREQHLVGSLFCPADCNLLAFLQPSQHRWHRERPIGQSSCLVGVGLAFRSFTHFQLGGESSLFYPVKLVALKGFALGEGLLAQPLSAP